MAKVKAYIFYTLFFWSSLHGASLAQTVTPINTPPDTSNTPNSLSLILNIIDQISTIIPGVGFNSIRIGDPVSRIVENLGAPHSVDKNKRLLYQLDEKTFYGFSGRKTIQQITATGLKGSLARLNNGITFGISPSQVVAKFNQKPNRASKRTVRYKSLGIEFQFDQNRLRTIVIFEPR